MSGPTILVAEDDPSMLAMFRTVLADQGRFRVETALNGAEALERAYATLPDLIVSDYAMPVMDGFELCRRVRSDPVLGSCMFLIISAAGDVGLKVEALSLGVDDFLTKPVDAAELVARVQAMLRIKRLADELRAEKTEEELLRGALERSFGQLLALLVHLLDLHRPGSAERGRLLASVALRVAERFEIPPELHRDLEFAAMLQEVGRVIVRESPAASFSPEGWHYAAVSQALLQGVDRLQGAAELVGSMCENWDGTGLPAHRQRGDIPLRSRILRVVRDFYAELDRIGPAGGTAEDVLSALAARRGTWYDPLVVAHLEAVVTGLPEEDWSQTRIRLPVDGLREGMVLADDLTTSAGVKLLARGAALSRNTLEIIRRRHQTDPFVHGVWVRRR